MKAYLVQHSFNKKNEGAMMFECVHAYTKIEDARNKLEEINKSIEDGTSDYFPNQKLNGKRETFIYDGYHYKWEDFNGDTMYSHVFIKEVLLD